MDEQQTTPEQRAALRRQYAPYTVRGEKWHRNGWVEMTALLDDADALAGALATVGRFRDSLAFYRTEAERYRAALCFYADPHLYADHFEHDPVDYERVSSVDIDGGAIARAALDPTDATSDRTTEGAPS